MGFFDGKNFDSSGKTPKSGGFFSSYNVPISVTNKTIPNAREEAIARGEAVGSASRFEKTGKVAPSFFGGIVRDLIKPEAQIVKWAGDVGTTAPKSSYSEYLGTLSPNTGLRPETFGKDFKQAAGVGMQAGVNLAGIGFTSVGKTAVGGVIKKKVADVATKDLIKGLAKEGATYGAGSSLGSSLEKNDNLKNTLINTAKGTVAGAVLNTAIGLGAKSLLGKGKIKPKDETPIVSTTPDLPIKTQEVTPSMAPQSPIINQVDSNVAGGIKQPVIENMAKIKQDTEHLIRDAGESVDNPLVYSTHEDWSRKVNSLPEDVQNSVAMGGKNPFPEVPAEAFKSIVAKRAEDMGDQNLIYKLSKDTSVKTASSKSAQELNAINMSSKDSTVRIVDRINTEIQQKLSPVMKEKINKESIDVTKKVLNDVKNAKPRKEIVDSVLSMLMCK
jgi:hypothetical protein